jgi:hypothetical protein
MPGTLPIGICKNGLVELTANWRAGSSVVDIVSPFICLINASEGFLAKVTKTCGFSRSAVLLRLLLRVWYVGVRWRFALACLDASGQIHKELSPFCGLRVGVGNSGLLGYELFKFMNPLRFASDSSLDVGGP